MDQEGSKTLQYEYSRTGKWWLFVMAITCIIFVVVQIVLIIVYPALAACFAPLTAF